MSHLDSDQTLRFLLALGALLASARILGELGRRFGQPGVFGEIVAGVLLGPTVLGALAPGAFAWLFPAEGPAAVALSGFTTLAITLFLLVAGMEVNLSTIWRQGRTALTVGLAGILGPFAIGFGVAILLPEALGSGADVPPHVFALFIATALSISALPVIARTLMDLDLYRSDLGMVVIAAAVFNDVVGWLVFALVLGLLGQGAGSHDFLTTLIVVLSFSTLMLTVGRALVHRALPWLQAHTAWPAGVLGFALSLALFAAAFTEWGGVHAVFGAFLAGVALGDSPRLRQRTRATIGQFVSFIFAPLFFASIGLQVDFVAHFDLLLVLAVTGIACVGKVVACWAGARLARVPPREAWALGFGMNARGAMEIILGLLALQYGVIGERLFVALVVMALATSLMSGPVMQRILRLQRPRRFDAFLRPRGFVPALPPGDRTAAIRTLAAAAAPDAERDAAELADAVLAREALMSTGITGGIAVPHARIAGLAGPVVAVGLSPDGVDFDARDGRPAQLVFLLLTPEDDDGAQVEILASIARTFREAPQREHALKAETHTQFLAVVRSTDTEE